MARKLIEAGVAQNAVPDIEEGIDHRSRWSDWWLTVFHDKKALAGLIVLTIFLIMGVLAPLIAPKDPNAMDYEMMEPPSWIHPLGTDDLGRDLLSRIIYGTRVSLFIGITTVAISLIAGVILGLVAGYTGGWIDNIIMIKKFYGLVFQGYATNLKMTPATLNT